MNAIFFKELRENLKWAGMICAVFCVLILLRMWHTGPWFLFDLQEPLTLIYAPLAGLVMGVAQTLFETRPDNWAFVVHRPVPRAGVFAAKCAAGLLLLYAALALPCLLACEWAARPGNLPMPFQGRTALPLLADDFTAGCYYFVGILLTLRKASWFGTRLLPAGMAFLCSLAVRLAPEFWQAVAFILLGHCIGAMAAWRAFATAGATDRPGAAAFGLGAMIYAGALTVGCFLVGALGLFDSTVRWHETRMDLAGNVVLITKTLEDGALNYVATDVAGERLAEYEGMNFDDPANADRFVRFTGALFDDRLLPWPISTMSGGGYRSARAGILALRTIGRPGARLASNPLFDVQQRIIDLYDPVTCALVGRVGPAGFSPGQAPPVERFPAAPLNPSAQAGTRTLAFPSSVYWMELDQRRVRRIFTASDDDPVVCAHELPPQTDPTIVIATRGRLHLIEPSGGQRFSIPLDLDLNQYAIEAGFLPSNHHLVLRAKARSPDLEDAAPPQFLEYSADGKLSRRTQPPTPEETGGVVVARTAAFGFIYPLAGLPLHRAWIVDNVFDLDSQHHPWLFRDCVLGASVLAGAITMLLCRGRYGFGVGKSIAWSAANLLLGPAGVVAMLGQNESPAHEACAACGGQRLSGRRQCQACGAPLPLPAPTGREIFDPADAFPPTQDALQPA